MNCYTEHFVISSHDIDINGNVRPSIVCRLMQETANHHMRDRKPTYNELFEKGQSYIAIRMAIEQPAQLHMYEEVSVDTWTCSGKGATFLRCYRIRRGDEVRSYVVEKHEVKDDHGHLTGSFLSVRDNTAEQMTLRAEIYKATHDPLTDVYNRAGYNLLMSKMELWKTIMLLVDGDCFKSVNDTYGHEIGDKALQKIANTLKYCFRSEDYVCRIGGDEFVVLMLHSDSAQKELIMNRVRKINQILSTGEGEIPPVTVSVGIAHGQDASYPEQLFEHADRALYETKKNGKKGYTFYEDLVSKTE